MSTKESRGELLSQFVRIRDRLAEYGIRGASDYAEILIAEAVSGRRVASRVTQGHDVTSRSYGRIEVKCRQLPSDGRIEERVEIGASKKGGFEHLAVVIFRGDFSVKSAVIVPYESVWVAVENNDYRRIAFSHLQRLHGAVDLTNRVSAVAQK